MIYWLIQRGLESITQPRGLLNEIERKNLLEENQYGSPIHWESFENLRQQSGQGLHQEAKDLSLVSQHLITG